MSASAIPAEWEQTTIGEVAELNPKQQLDDDLSVGFLPMSGVPTEYLGRSAFEEKPWREVRKGYTHFKDGDVLIAKITPCFENGKAAIVENFPNGFGAGSTEYHVLRTIDTVVVPKILLALSKTRDFLVNGATNMTGSVGHKRVPKEFVESYPLPLPPLAEQKQIAAKLDELLAQVDTLKARLDAIPTILKRFRQSVLAAAVSGRLTEGWREEQSLPIPSNTILEKHCEVLGGKRLPKGFELTEENSGFPYIRVTDFSKFSVKPEQIRFVPAEAAQQIKKYIINSHDVYISIAGTIGLVGQIPERFSGSNLTENAARIVINDSLVPKFLMYQLASPTLQDQMREKKIATTQEKLGLFRIKSLEISVPSIEEQTEIVRRVEQLFAFANQIEQRVRDAQARVNHLTQSVLAKAFRGELTADWRAQNPDLISGDNSAEALLARIRAARAAQPKAKRGRRSAP